MFRKNKLNQEIQRVDYILPPEIWVLIFSHLNLTTLGALLNTNKNFFNLLISPSANFVWETQIAHHFPNRYKKFENEKKYPDNSYQAFLGYYQVQKNFPDLTQEQEKIFSYFIEENISALSTYNVNGTTPIRYDQIPFHFLEWVAEHASETFKDYLCRNVYSSMINSPYYSDYFKIFPEVELTWAWHEDKGNLKDQACNRYYNEFQHAHLYLKMLALLFLGRDSDSLIVTSSLIRVSRKGFFHDLHGFFVCNDAEKIKKFFGERYKHYVENSAWYLGRYCSLSGLDILKKDFRFDFDKPFVAAVVERGDKEILKAVIGTDSTVANWAVLEAIKKNNMPMLKLLLSTYKLSDTWQNFFNILTIIQDLTLETFLYLSQNLKGFFNFEKDFDFFRPLYFEQAMIFGRMELVNFFIEKEIQFYEGEKNSRPEFAQSFFLRTYSSVAFFDKKKWEEEIYWSRQNHLNDWKYETAFSKKLFSLKCGVRSEESRQLIYMQPIVCFLPPTQETQNLPNQMINFFMVQLLREWYRYQYFLDPQNKEPDPGRSFTWYECEFSWQKNPKLGSIHDLIMLVINKQDQYFEDLIEEWKKAKHPLRSNETNLDIIAKKQGDSTALSKATKDVFDSVVLPALSFFSESKEVVAWVADKSKTNTEKFIDELVRGSRLFARPRVEVVAQDGNEKAFVKKQ